MPIVPSVTMKGLMRSRVTIAPFASPATVPARMPTTMATQIGWCCSIRMVPSSPASARIEPTDRSMPPAMMMTVMPSATDGAPPVVYGEMLTPGAARTVVFYAHYDGQPLDPKEWATDPWKPTLKGDRIYARSSSDDKAPIIALMTAVDALKAANIALKQNVKFVFEGEEEAGSRHLGQILEANKQLLKADVWLICDGPVHQSGRRQIVFGARGVETVDVTVYGPKRELHSGHYGNWAPNPAMMLARLLASMKDDDGRVLVDHFYDGIEPLSATEKRAIADAPDVDEELKRELWLGRTEGGGRKL